MPRTHERDYFFKYMTSGTAKVVLSNSSLRWSSPLLFNDPFDHQIDFNFDFTETEFVESYLKAFEQVIFGSDEVSFDIDTRPGALNSVMRQKRNELNKNDALKELKRGVEETARKLEAFKDNVNAELQKHLKNVRVLCVSEAHDNVVMWSHYANDHKGVVMRLQCIDEIDNTLLAAKKIGYNKKLPVIASLDEMVKNTLGIQKHNYAKLFTDLSYVKHNDWQYEREWRVAFPEAATTGLHKDIQENPRVFGSVYMGCRIEPVDETDILSLLRGPLSHVEVYKATKRKVEFGLDFERIR